MSSLKEIELFNAEPNIATQEDFFELYKNEESYIFYVRNYDSQIEYIIISYDLLMKIPDNLRASSNVYFKNNFFVLLYFKNIIRQHILETGQLNHFYSLFDMSLTDFFDQV